MTYFADQAVSVVTPLVENVLIARDTRRLRVCVPQMAQHVVPGQFFMLRNPASNDPLIGRAFALYDLNPETCELDLVYVVKGKLTSSVQHLKAGDPMALWGPLGNGFPPTPVQHLVMVAGGIGQTPFLALAKEALGQQQFSRPGMRPSGYARRVSLCYGTRSADYLAGVAAFESVGVDVKIATEDGSIGPARRVSSLLEEVLDAVDPLESIRVVCCGPEPMMQAVARIAEHRSLACQVSLETPMACGIGICFTCVAKVGSASDWDYKRTCVEGPVFDAAEIQWP